MRHQTVPTTSPDRGGTTPVSTVAELRSPSNWIFSQAIAIYGVFLLAATLAYITQSQPLWIRGCAYFGAWLMTGWGQFALFNALHEGLHRRFGRPHRELLGFLLTAYPVGFSPSYRQLHLDHHRYFGESIRDPDYPNYGNFPRTKLQFLTRVAWNASGVAAGLQFLGLRQRGEFSSQTRPPLEWLQLGLVQLTILACYSIFLGPLYYLTLWLIPLATSAKLFAFLRTFCEHADPHDRRTIRTITGKVPDTRILGVFCFRYHAEHHQKIHVPCNQLPAAHNLLKDELYRSDADGIQYEHWNRGYWRLLCHWYQNLPAAVTSP